MSVIIGNSDGGQIGEKSEEDNQLDTDGLVDDDHGGDEVDFQVQAERDTVLDIGLHPLENLTRDLDGRDDGAETRGEEDDIGGGLSGFGSTFDGDTTVRLLQRGGIVDTVTSHGREMSTLLQHFYDLVLVLRENLSEPIGLLDEVVLSGTAETTVDQTFRVVDLGAERQHLAGLLGNSDGVTCQHLDRETEDLSFSDGGCGILTRGVEHGQHSQQLPVTVTFLDSNTERAETTASELGGLVLVHALVFLGAGAEVENGLGSTLGSDELLTISGDLGRDTLGYGVEGSVFLGLPVSSEDLLGFWVTLEGQDGNLVNGVERFDIVRRSESSDCHHPVDINAFGNEWLPNGKLVRSESTGLIGAENVNTSEGLNGGQFLHDGLLLGEISGSDSESSGSDDGQTDGDTNNQEDKGIVEQVVGAEFGSRNLQVVEETANPSDENPAYDQNQQTRTDRVHDRLEMTLILCTRDQRCGASNEGHLSTVCDNSKGLSSLATSCVVDNVGDVLVDSEGFSSHGRLIDSKNGVSGSVPLSFLVIFIILLVGRLSKLGVQFSAVSFVAVGVVVGADNPGIGGDNLTVFDDDLNDTRLISSSGRARSIDLQCHPEPIHEP